MNTEAVIEVNKEIENMVKTKKLLQQEIKKIDKKLKPLLRELKDTCQKIGITTLDYGMFKVVYTPPSKYFRLVHSLEAIAKMHPTYVEEKIGYEKITFTPKK